MGTCFVMQPFDGGIFDRRYEETFAPAIREAGLEPYRVDQDPKAAIPIQEIESGIREAQLCLADITLDNPNVWFELGYAIACKKEVLLVCSDERTTKFPFDVQHRIVIKYATKSASDFEKLSEQIVARLKAYISKAETLEGVSEIAKLTTFEGLDHHEVVTLAAMAENFKDPENDATMYQIRRDMEASGYTKIAATLAVRSLTQKQFIESGQREDFEDGGYYTGYWFTEKGWAWLLANQERFVLKRPTSDDDIPF